MDTLLKVARALPEANFAETAPETGENQRHPPPRPKHTQFLLSKSSPLRPFGKQKTTKKKNSSSMLRQIIDASQPTKRFTQGTKTTPMLWPLLLSSKTGFSNGIKKKGGRGFGGTTTPLAHFHQVLPVLSFRLAGRMVMILVGGWIGRRRRKYGEEG